MQTQSGSNLQSLQQIKEYHKINKTYKTVYNAVSGTWAAVSELAKSQGKNTTRAAAALVLLAVSPAWGA